MRRNGGSSFHHLHPEHIDELDLEGTVPEFFSEHYKKFGEKGKESHQGGIKFNRSPSSQS